MPNLKVREFKKFKKFELFKVEVLLVITGKPQTLAREISGYKVGV